MVLKRKVLFWIEHFKQGGSRRFRGFRPSDYEGSLLWVGSVEWRFPLVRKMNAAVTANILRPCGTGPCRKEMKTRLAK